MRESPTKRARGGNGGDRAESVSTGKRKVGEHSEIETTKSLVYCGFSREHATNKWSDPWLDDAPRARSPSRTGTCDDDDDAVLLPLFLLLDSTARRLDSTARRAPLPPTSSPLPWPTGTHLLWFNHSHATHHATTPRAPMRDDTKTTYLPTTHTSEITSRHDKASSTTDVMSSHGASFPVKSRNCSAACPTNISTPFATPTPCSWASRSNRVYCS